MRAMGQPLFSENTEIPSKITENSGSLLDQKRRRDPNGADKTALFKMINNR